MNKSSLLCALALAPMLLTPACATGGDTRARIDTLVGNAACRADAECRSSPVGRQACGGPESFIAWSAQQTRAEALQAAIADHDAAALRATPPDRMSTCQVRVDPGAYCRPPAAGTPGRCMLRPASGPGALPTR